MNNTVKTLLIVGGVLIAIFVLLIGLGSWALWVYQEPALALNDIDLATGNVWNSVSNCDAKLENLEAQAKFWAKTNQSMIDSITAGRSDLKALTDAYKGKTFDGKADAKLAEILEKFNSPNSGIMFQMKSLVENYPGDLSNKQIMVGLMDETASCFNAIKFSRSKLIDSQGAYNALLIKKPWAGLLGFRKVDILGSDANPAAPARKSGMNDTPIPPAK